MNEYELKLHEVATERGYKVLGQYVNSKTKLEIVCPKGHHFFMIPEAFYGKQQQGCKVCSGKCRKTSAENFEKLLIDRGYSLVGEYLNNHTRVEIICNKGHKFDMTPSSIKAGCSCRVCTGNDPAYAEVKFKKSVTISGYSLIGEYVASGEPVEMICPRGHVWNIRPASFAKGTRCSTCSNNNKQKSKSDFLNFAESKNVTVLSEYVNARTKVKIMCQKGHVSSITPDGFKISTGCPQCATTGYKSSKRGYLYILRHEYNNHFKIGISNSYEKRISNLRLTTPFDFDVVAVFEGDGQEIIDLEQAIHKTMPSAGYKGFDGCTEWIIATNDIILLPEVLGLKHA